MGKLSLGLGLGVGYVLGARAGKERYEQIKQATSGFLGRPEVQQTIEKARDAAPAPLQEGIDKLTGGTSGSQGGGPRGGGSRGGGPRGGGLRGGRGRGGGRSAGAGIPDTEALVAEAAVVEAVDVDAAEIEAIILEETDVTLTPPPPVSGAGGLGGMADPLADPLIPPARTDEGPAGRR